jgi:hypothetical protein
MTETKIARKVNAFLMRPQTPNIFQVNGEYSAFPFPFS